MTNHPRRAMKAEILHDTLDCPSRPGQSWSWKTRVTLGDREFLVTQHSMLGAYQGDTATALVEAYLDGTLKNQTVKEVSR